MSHQSPSFQSSAERFFGLGAMIAAAVACFIAWKLTAGVAYSVATAGFLFLAPLWYRSPISFNALRAPLGTKLTARRPFSLVDILLTVIGYGLVLVSIGIFFLA